MSGSPIRLRADIHYWRAVALWCSVENYAAELQWHFATREDIGRPDTMRLIDTGAHVFTIQNGRIRIPPDPESR